MDREQIKELLREVLGPNTVFVDHQRWVGLHCPLAPWKHASGRDSSPSAGVSIKDNGDPSIFHCYGCHSKGPLSYLLKELEKFTGDNHSALIRELDSEEFLGGALPDWKAGRVGRTPKLHYLNKEEYLDLYDSAEGHWYLAERGISDATARGLGLLVDPEDSEMEERILFPVMDQQGRLLGFSGRATDRRARLKVRDYHGLPKAHCLLGAHLITPETPYVVLVEGLFDYARMREFGEPAVAVMHSGLTEYQLRALLNMGLPLVSMLDNDDAGRDATEKVIEMVVGKLPLSVAKYPRRGTKLRPKPSPKDPGTCTFEEVKWAIEHATIV